MTREEALVIVLKAIEHECHFDACPTIERAHEVIRSEKDEGGPLIANPTIKSMLFFDRLAGPTTYYGSENDEDLGIGVEGQPRGDVHYRLTPIYYGSEHDADAPPPEHITFGDLLDECEAAAALVEAAAYDVFKFASPSRLVEYDLLRERRERLMNPRPPTTADKGEGGDDRAS